MFAVTKVVEPERSEDISSLRTLSIHMSKDEYSEEHKWCTHLAVGSWSASENVRQFCGVFDNDSTYADLLWRSTLSNHSKSI
jgi:hypothetical protein